MARRQEFSEDLDDGDTGPSKSELKRQDRDLRELGVALVELPLANSKRCNYRKNCWMP